MPILPRETDLYPHDLLDPPTRSGGSSTCWWAIYTRSRREKELARWLHAEELSFYAPLIGRRSESASGRVRQSFVPLFPGYLFLSGDDGDRSKAWRSNCVSRTIPVLDGNQLVRELSQVKRLIDSDVPLTPESKLEPGQRIRISHGSLSGVEGTIIQRRGESRLIISVDFLQRGASIRLEDYQINPLV